MKKYDLDKRRVLSVVIPCYQEEHTLRASVERLMTIKDEYLALEVVIIDDSSKDASYTIALELAETYSEIKVQRHKKNRGKGAALRTGFATAGSLIANFAGRRYLVFPEKPSGPWKSTGSVVQRISAMESQDVV